MYEYNTLAVGRMKHAPIQNIRFCIVSTVPLLNALARRAAGARGAGGGVCNIKRFKQFQLQREHLASLMRQLASCVTHLNMLV